MGIDVLLIGMLLGILLVFGIWYFRYKKSKQHQLQTQSTILLEKIKSVCKLITVEGDFSEVYPHKHIKSKFFDLVSSEKKALILVNAKAHMGFDLQQMKLNVNTNTKTIQITEFPEPSLLSLVPEIQYYDKKEGWFNTFSSEDLNALQTQAKQQILEKIPYSNLHTATWEKAIETFTVVAHVAQTIGWKLDFQLVSKQLKQHTEKQPLLIEKHNTAKS